MTDLLYSYTTTVKFLGSVLGPDYEVVLQDLSNINHSVIAIENGHISGRTIGSPLTSAVFQMLSSKVYEEDDFIANYKGVAENGHILRSSSMFIKDSNGNPIGLLCINFDDSSYMELHEKLFSLIHPGNFVKNILDIIDETGLSKLLKSKIKDSSRTDLGKDERYGRRVMFEFNKSYPVVLSPMLHKEELKKYVFKFLSYYYDGDLEEFKNR